MSPFVLLIAILVTIAVYIGCVALLPKKLLEDADPRIKSSLRRLKDEQQMLREGNASDSQDEGRGSDYIDNPLTRAFLMLPLANRLLPPLRKAGLGGNLDKFILATLAVFIGFVWLTARFGIAGIPLAMIATWLAMALYLRRRRKKMRKQFLDSFPDALDMIVRSVRSGYPLTSALGMVADNIGPPIGQEFKRIIDETNYGWTLNEALNRFAERLNEPDINFFVIVLAVQQETGGNLSEVLSSLSNVLRQRKQLRLKIHALSSEGRATAWVLGSLPVFIFLIINYMAPDHMTPLFTTTTGYMVLAGVVGMVVGGMAIVRAMINIEI